MRKMKKRGKGMATKKRSAGLLPFRKVSGTIEVLLVHPGGPFWVKKDEGAWSIPKGEIEGNEDPQVAARREFEEEVGGMVVGDMIALEPVRLPGGKLVYAWAVEMDLEPSRVKSNTFTMEWPPKSGKIAEFPEIDRAEWFTLDVARRKIVKGQVSFLDQLERILIGGRGNL